MKPRFLMHFLYSLQGQFWGFHFLIAFLKALKPERDPWVPLDLNPKFFGSRKEKKYIPWKVLFTFGTEDSEAWRKLYWTLRLEKISLKIGRAGSLLSLKSSVASICRFPMCISTDLSVYKGFSKDDDLSLHTMCRHLSWKLFILLFIVRLWNIHTKGL